MSSTMIGRRRADQPVLREMICEGDCNPAREAVDEMVRAYRRRESAGVSGQYIPLDDDVILGNLRRLRHTPHEPNTTTYGGHVPGSWRCTICRVVRRG